MHGLVFFLDDEDALLRQPEQLEELKHPRRDLPRVDLDENDFASVVGIFDHVPHSRHALGDEMPEVTDHSAAPNDFFIGLDELFSIDLISLVETTPAVHFTGRNVRVARDEFKILIAHAAFITVLVFELLHLSSQDDPVFERLDGREPIGIIIFIEHIFPMVEIGHVQPPFEFIVVHRHCSPPLSLSLRISTPFAN